MHTAPDKHIAADSEWPCSCRFPINLSFTGSTIDYCFTSSLCSPLFGFIVEVYILTLRCKRAHYLNPYLVLYQRSSFSITWECGFKFLVFFNTVGYMNPSGQWEENPHYVNMEGLHSVSPVSNWTTKLLCFFLMISF